MKNFIIILFLVNLFSCGARKSDSHIEKKSGTELTEGSNETDLKIKREGTFNQNHTITDLGYGFSVEPVNGQNSFFYLKSGKDSVEVRTNAKVNFNKNNKTENVVTVYKYIDQTTYKSHIRYKTHFTYKTYLKNKSTKKEAYPWFLWFLLGMVSMVILRFVVNKNNLVSIWNYLIKKS